MIAFLSSLGNVPVAIELLMIEVINGSSSSMHCFKSQVGNGSSAQNLLP